MRLGWSLFWAAYEEILQAIVAIGGRKRGNPSRLADCASSRARLETWNKLGQRLQQTIVEYE